MKRFIVPIVFLAGAIVFCLWWYSPTQVIKRRTASLLSTLTMAAGDGKANRHMGAYSLNGLLAPQVALETPTIDEANGTFEREDDAYRWQAHDVTALERPPMATVSREAAAR